jgi:hypothetical protein
MSDITDRVIWRIEKDVQNARAHLSKQTMLESDGRCHFCDEAIAHTPLFSNKDQG